MKFPSTRVLDSDYGLILSSNYRNSGVLKRLDTCLSEGNINAVGDITSFRPVIPPYNNPLCVSVSGSTSYSDRVQASKISIAQRIASLKRSIACQKKRITSLEPAVTSLLAASRHDPAHCAYLLQSYSRNARPSLAVVKPIIKATCGGVDCKQTTLPYSKFCLQHQSCEVSQRLYGCCTGLDPNTLTQCSATVTDIFSEAPLCSKHNAMDTGVASGQVRKKLGSHGITRPVQKKSSAAKTGVTKIVRGKKTGPHLKSKPSQHEVKVAPSWSSTIGVVQEEKKAPVASSTPVPPSKSLDDLLTLGSSLTSSLPKLDLLPLKADIGEIMMAGEDSCSDHDEEDNRELL